MPTHALGVATKAEEEKTEKYADFIAGQAGRLFPLVLENTGAHGRGLTRFLRKLAHAQRNLPLSFIPTSTCKTFLAFSTQRLACTLATAQAKAEQKLWLSSPVTGRM